MKNITTTIHAVWLALKVADFKSAWQLLSLKDNEPFFEAMNSLEDDLNQS